MNTLSVSSYSLREQLGPLAFDFVDPGGEDVHIHLPYPKLLNLSEFPARAKDTFGVDAIETVAFQFAGMDDPEIDRFAAALVSSEVRLVNVAIDGGNLAAVDHGEREADIRFLQRWIERFAGMGPEFVRVNPGSPFGPRDDARPPAHLVDAVGEVGAFAKKHGARLLVENHGGASSDPEWMTQLLDDVGRDACGLLLDLGNFDAVTGPLMPVLFGGGTGADPLEMFAGIDLSTVYEGIDSLAGYAELVSLKAHHVSDDGLAGPVDLVRSLGILAAHGYAGPLSVEYEGNGGDPWAKSTRVLEIARTVLESSTTTAGER
jgi:sugar phosphate isomerase/epimerase